MKGSNFSMNYTMLRVVTLFIVILVDLLRFTSNGFAQVLYTLQIFLLQNKLATLNYPFGISHMLFESHLLISQLRSDSFLCNVLTSVFHGVLHRKPQWAQSLFLELTCRAQVSKELILSSFS